MDNFLGEIRLFPFGVIPKGWAPCNGQLLPITMYSALFTLLGTQYGGDGSSTFALPDMRGRVGLGATADGTHPNGQSQGSQSVTLTADNLPPHTHTVNVSTLDTGNSAAEDAFFGVSLLNNGSPGGTTYVEAKSGNPVSLNSATVGTSGASSPLENHQPSLGLSYCIALQGVYPPRS